MSGITIITILIILVICITAITIIQKKEQKKAALRQRAAQFRYRANQASTILSNIGHLPIGQETRQILMLYSLANLKSIAQLIPDDLNNNNNIEALESHLKNPINSADKKQLIIPSDMAQIKQQINGLNKLAKYIVKIQKSNVKITKLAPIAVNRVMSLISESKISAYIKQGEALLAKDEHAQAQSIFSTTQEMLNKIKNKNKRLEGLESDLQKLITNTSSNVKKTEPATDKAPKPSSENSDSDDIKERSSNLFGPKKKW